MITDPVKSYSSNQMAGKNITVQGDNAQNCLNPEPARSNTPENIKKYRKSYKNQEGKTILHHGIYDDQRPENIVHGRAIVDSDHVNDVFKHSKGIQNFVNEIKEQKYQSRVKEPLGKKAEKNYQYPDQVNNQNFMFGTQTIGNEYSAKEVMFPQNPIKNEKQDLQNYKKSHQTYQVGEQKQRNYNTPFDKDQQIFGKKNKPANNEINQCLKGNEDFPETRIIDKKQNDYKHLKYEQLGKVKNLAQINPNINEDTVFGQRKIDKEQQQEWNVGQCISGQPTVKDTQPDNNLGKTNKFGFRNQVKENDQNRIFGIPTIRTDLKEPQVRSVADPQSYNNDESAINLIHPEKYAYRGVFINDFNEQKEPLEVREIFANIGYCYGEGKFQAILQRAKQIEGSQGVNDLVSIKAFQLAVQELHEVN